MPESTATGIAAAAGAADWRSQIPEDLKDEKTLSPEVAPDLPSLIRTAVHAQRMLGKSIRILDEKATADERVKWEDETYARLGRPAKSEDYQITRPDLPEGFTWNDNLEKWFRTVSHSIGLNSKQVQKLVDDYVKWEMEQEKIARVELEDGLAKLKAEMGDDFPRAARGARAVVFRVGGEEFMKFLDDSGLGDHPAMIRFCARLGDLLGEDVLQLPGEIDVGEIHSAKAKIAAILQDPKHPYHLKKGELGHKEAVEEMFKLQQIAAMEG